MGVAKGVLVARLSLNRTFMELKSASLRRHPRSAGRLNRTFMELKLTLSNTNDSVEFES